MTLWRIPFGCTLHTVPIVDLTLSFYRLQIILFFLLWNMNMDIFPLFDFYCFPFSIFRKLFHDFFSFFKKNEQMDHKNHGLNNSTHLNIDRTIWAKKNIGNNIISLYEYVMVSPCKYNSMGYECQGQHFFSLLKRKRSQPKQEFSRNLTFQIAFVFTLYD